MFSTTGAISASVVSPDNHRCSANVDQVVEFRSPFASSAPQITWGLHSGPQPEMRCSRVSWSGESIFASWPVWMPGTLKCLAAIPGRVVKTIGVLWTVEGCLSPAPPNINLALGPGSHTAMGGPGWSQQTDPSGNRKILPTLAVLSGPPQWGVEQAHERGFEVWPRQALEPGPGCPQHQ